MARKRNDDTENQDTVDRDAVSVDVEAGGRAGVLGADSALERPAAEPPTEAASDAPDSAAPSLTLERDPATEEQPARARRPRRDKGQPRGPRAVTDPKQAKADKVLLARAFEGTFLMLGMALGPHWMLKGTEMPKPDELPESESAMLAEVWQPIFEKYGAEKTTEALMWTSAATVTVAVMVPRVKLSVQHDSGVVGWIKRKIAARRMRRSA